MNTNDLNTALYEKMAAEQDKYRDWLKSQPDVYKRQSSFSSGKSSCTT